MKRILLLALTSAVLTACSGSGGPATRAGRAVDNAVYHVGQGVERTGETIEDVATGD